jgi:hypothetical protein
MNSEHVQNLSIVGYSIRQILTMVRIWFTPDNAFIWGKTIPLGRVGT